MNSYTTVLYSSQNLTCFVLFCMFNGSADNSASCISNDGFNVIKAGSVILEKPEGLKRKSLEGVVYLFIFIFFTAV